jgi:hypothetical protein
MPSARYLDIEIGLAAARPLAVEHRRMADQLEDMRSLGTPENQHAILAKNRITNTIQTAISKITQAQS